MAGRNLPELELQCMRALWRLQPATVGEIRAALDRPLAYTTVMTILDRLTTKGVVARQKRGRAFSYRPLLDLESARHAAVARILANYFDGDPEALLRYLRSPEGAPAAAASRPAAKARARAAAATHSMDDSLL